MKTDRTSVHLHSLRIGMDKHGVLVLNLRRPAPRPGAGQENAGSRMPLKTALDRVLDFLFAP